MPKIYGPRQFRADHHSGDTHDNFEIKLAIQSVILT